MPHALNPALEPDEALIASTVSGDRDAFLALYDRYSPRLLGLIKTVVRDRHSSEEVLQAVMFEVWQRHAARYKPMLGSVEGWLLRLARARAIDHVRSTGRRRAEPIDEAHAALECAGSGSGVDETDRRILKEAVAELPDEERVPISLAFMHGLSREEIAAQCGVPVGTVKTRIRRGVYRLRELLSQAGVA